MSYSERSVHLEAGRETPCTAVVPAELPQLAGLRGRDGSAKVAGVIVPDGRVPSKVEWTRGTAIELVGEGDPSARIAGVKGAPIRLDGDRTLVAVEGAKGETWWQVVDGRGTPVGERVEDARLVSLGTVAGGVFALATVGGLVVPLDARGEPFLNEVPGFLGCRPQKVGSGTDEHVEAFWVWSRPLALKLHKRYVEAERNRGKLNPEELAEKRQAYEQQLVRIDALTAQQKFTEAAALAWTVECREDWHIRAACRVVAAAAKAGRLGVLKDRELNDAYGYGEKYGLSQAVRDAANKVLVDRAPPVPRQESSGVVVQGDGYHGGGGGGNSGGGGWSPPTWTPSASAQVSMYRRDLDTRVRANTFGR